MGEKATMLREKENKLSFIVSSESTRKDVKEAIESLYSVKVVRVHSMNTVQGNKKVHVKLAPEFSAEEVASHFGVL
jgi:large subunit ribosomal protein L23